MNKKIRTIGILSSGITEEYSGQICRGAVDRALMEGINVIIFPGKYLDVRDDILQKESSFEYQYQVLFDEAKKAGVDAFICTAGSIGNYTSRKKLRAFIEGFKDYPIVLCGMHMEGYYSVNYDNTRGVHEGLEFLYDKLGVRKFACLAGSSENTDMLEREMAFCAFMESHDLEVTKDQIVRCLLPRHKDKSTAMILDQNPGVEAIFCANDDTALAVYEEMYYRGLTPGKDIYILGFDDVSGAANASPSLSTIHADAQRIGMECVSLLQKICSDAPLSDRIDFRIPCPLIIRDSFGKGSNKIVSDLNYASDSMNSSLLRNSHSIKTEEYLRNKQLYDAIPVIIENAVASNSEKDFNEQLFNISNLLSDATEKAGATAFLDISSTINYLTKLEQQLRHKYQSEDSLSRLYSVFSLVFKKMVKALNEENGRLTREKMLNEQEMRLFCRRTMSFTTGNDKSYSAILSDLGWLGIDKAALCLTPRMFIHDFRDEYELPDKLLLKAILRDGRVSSPKKQEMTMEEIFKKLSNGEKNQYVMFPIFYGNEYYGFLICNMTEDLYINGDFLAGQAGCAARMISLLHLNEVTSDKLDKLSRIDPLTGILNRRGFTDAAYELFAEEEKGMASHLLLLYLDLNWLKEINDEFGHEEGDHAIRCVGEIITKEAEDKGYAARIGGDEFACLFRCSDKEAADNAILSMRKAFDELNDMSDKPYLVSVSIGSCFVKGGYPKVLDDMLEEADKSMYLEKKNIHKQKGSGFRK
ncbi:diguanylate cyclase domain-containing protein [Butyrivibrio sp. MC2013]|uniref:diguanylate cyclase domain-containing protein n=1 Tax=Butyrivibrio sp. MC2013 TaxID=1280686 RepID=UPI0003F9AE5F|nr:diguanylate cyclase [Butyrivibrio sp. MC2013]